MIALNTAFSFNLTSSCSGYSAFIWSYSVSKTCDFLSFETRVTDIRDLEVFDCFGFPSP